MRNYQNAQPEKVRGMRCCRPLAAFIASYGLGDDFNPRREHAEAMVQ